MRAAILTLMASKLKDILAQISIRRDYVLHNILRWKGLPVLVVIRQNLTIHRAAHTGCCVFFAHEQPVVLPQFSQTRQWPEIFIRIEEQVWHSSPV